MIEPGKPYHLDEFADLCEAHGLVIVPGSGRWLPHPTEEGREIWGVQVKLERKERENEREQD